MFQEQRPQLVRVDSAFDKIDKYLTTLCDLLVSQWLVLFVSQGLIYIVCESVDYI